MNALKTKRRLLIGIGNDGRADDALGWRFAEEIEKLNTFDVAYRYQLQIEDAELITQYDEVIFVDAHKEILPNGFSFYECIPTATPTFTTHRLSPETVLALMVSIFNTTTPCYVMAITGKKWKLEQGLSDVGARNLKQALTYFKQHIQNPVSEFSVHAFKPAL
jgi:hydrogenase maturation protease